MSKKATTPKKTALASKPQATKWLIPILVEQQLAAKKRSGDPDAQKSRGRLTQKALGLAEETLVSMVEKIDHVFGSAMKVLKNYQLDEVEVSLEVSASGELGLKFIAEGKAEGKGAITLKFKRKP